MSQGPLCPNLTKKVQKEVSQMANCNLSCVILVGGLSVNLNHLKTLCIPLMNCLSSLELTDFEIIVTNVLIVDHSFVHRYCAYQTQQNNN